MIKKGQNDISSEYLKGSDLAEREQEVLEDVSRNTGFVAIELIGRSTWWGSSEIGAFHYVGTFERKRAVLKIQGVKPAVSEIYMIESFSNVNTSKVLRPPHLYASLPWNDEKKYEALILEYVGGEKVIQTPTTDLQVRNFFELYRNYRDNCLHSPWIDKPESTISSEIVEKFKRWRKASFKIYPEHPLRKDEDTDLIDTAVKLLEKEYIGIEPEFMHGHLSESDLYEVGDQVVILSNLYWSWRQPFYDAVFGFHWFMYHLNSVEDITPEEIEQQRAKWVSEIEALPQVQSTEGRRMLDLALLERAVAGLNLDSLSIDPHRPTAAYLVESTRNQVVQLL